MKEVKIEWPTITAVTPFFVVADRSHHGYVSTSSNRKVFCPQWYLPDWVRLIWSEFGEKTHHRWQRACRYNLLKSGSGNFKKLKEVLFSQDAELTKIWPQSDKPWLEAKFLKTFFLQLEAINKYMLYWIPTFERIRNHMMELCSFYTFEHNS